MTAATTVDHIRSKRAGGTDDVENLQPLCNQCHKEKTATERFTAAPRVVVTGPPMCGKSSWVKERAKPGDIIWDLDDVASTMAFFGAPLTREQKGNLPWAVMKALLVMRDALVLWLEGTRLRDCGAFLIITDPADAQRVARRINAEVVDLTIKAKVSIT